MRLLCEKISDRKRILILPATFFTGKKFQSLQQKKQITKMELLGKIKFMPYTMLIPLKGNFSFLEKKIENPVSGK